MALPARPGRAIGDPRPFRLLSRPAPPAADMAGVALLRLARAPAEQQCPPVPPRAPRLIVPPLRSAWCRCGTRRR